MPGCHCRGTRADEWARDAPPGRQPTPAVRGTTARVGVAMNFDVGPVVVVVAPRDRRGGFSNILVKLWRLLPADSRTKNGAGRPHPHFRGGPRLWALSH